MKFGLSRRRRGRRGDGATISHKGPYVRHLIFDGQSRSDYSGIVEPFTNEIEECVEELCLKDITTETEPRLASEWVSMKQRAGNTPSLLQKDTQGLSGIRYKHLKKLLLQTILTIIKRRSIQAEVVLAGAYWYISGRPAETNPTAHYMGSGQDFVCYGLVVDVTWCIETGGELFKFRRQYGGYIPYVLNLAPQQESIQIPREMSLMDDGSSGLTAASQHSVVASVDLSQQSEDERFRGPRRARRFGRRAPSVEDSSTSISNASRVTRFKDMIRDLKPVRFAADKLSLYFEPSVLERELSQSADSLDRNSSDRESSQANRRVDKEGNQRKWVRPIGRALRGVADTIAARKGHSDIFVNPAWKTSGRSDSLNNSRRVESQTESKSEVYIPASTPDCSTLRSSISDLSALGTMTPCTTI